MTPDSEMVPVVSLEQRAGKMLHGDAEDNNGIRPSVTYADHSFPAFSKSQMIEFALAFAATIAAEADAAAIERAAGVVMEIARLLNASSRMAYKDGNRTAAAQYRAQEVQCESIATAIRASQPAAKGDA